MPPSEHLSRSGSRFPVKERSTCGCCGGPVNGFGCVRRCAESEEHRIDLYDLDNATPELRLQWITQLAGQQVHRIRPEYVPHELFSIYEIATGVRQR